MLKTTMLLLNSLNRFCEIGFELLGKDTITNI